MNREDSGSEAADLAARLEAAKARNSAAVQKRAELQKPTLVQQVQDAEREAAEAEALAKATAELGPEGKEWKALPTARGLVIFRRPDPIQFKRFQDMADIRLPQIEALVQPCVFYPDPAAYNAIADALPGVVTDALGLVSGLAGVRAALLSGK